MARCISSLLPNTQVADQQASLVVESDNTATSVLVKLQHSVTHVTPEDRDDASTYMSGKRKGHGQRWMTEAHRTERAQLTQ
jgi:hypothetical protein